MPCMAPVGRHRESSTPSAWGRHSDRFTDPIHGLESLDSGPLLSRPAGLPAPRSWREARPREGDRHPEAHAAVRRGPRVRPPAGAPRGRWIMLSPRMGELQLQNLHLTRVGTVATLTLDRPRALNALDAATLRELARAIRELRRDGGVRVLVVTGAGDKAFSAGARNPPTAAVSAARGAPS